MAETMRVYISHTAVCTGWDMDAIFKGTCFRKAARTNAVLNKGPAESDVKMLDWDFRGWELNPKKIEADHLQNVKEYKFDVVMSMDLFEYNIDECLAYTKELKKYCDRVLIPVHYFYDELLEYELAYPNANWFASNKYPPAKFRPNFTHILGGSPHSQLRLITTTQQDLFGNALQFPNIKSIDGNQIFNVAIQAGKYWSPTKPHWRKPNYYDHDWTNEEIFKLSVQNLDQEVRKPTESEPFF